MKRPGVIATAMASLVLVLLMASCSDGGERSTDTTAVQDLVESETEAVGTETGQDTERDEAGPTTEEGADETARPGGDGIIGALPALNVRLPAVVQIVPPDLSALSESGERLESQLGDILGAGSGLDVVSATCAAQGGALVYQGSDGNSFFDVDVDGSGVYRDLSGNNNLEIEVDPDGSGVYRDLGGSSDLAIQVDPDGSGTYRDLGGTTNLEIQVAADGTGSYRDLSVNYDIELIINPDGSGVFRDLSFSNDLEIEVNADGSGSYRDVGGEKDVNLKLFGDGSWTFTNGTLNQDVDLVVNADGSGTYRDLSGARDIEIEVASDGTGSYVDSGNGIEHLFTTEIGILDPELLVAYPLPDFVVAERFPPLDSLGRLEPPCVTVIRLDADVLFDFDSDRLRPEVEPVLDRLAAALIETGQAMEIHGHTDSTGDEAYNQDLAARRAEAFRTALVERGVTADLQTVSLGETRPVAPNEKADGSDNPAGRQLNRRIELVIPE